MRAFLSSASLVALLVLQIVSGQVCTVGRMNTDKTEGRSDNQFYLNHGHPATCNGTITSVSYCYFNPNENLRDEYVATFGVYRPQGSNNFSSVSRTLRLVVTKREIRENLGDRDFGCFDHDLNQPVAVQAGDMLGACVEDPAGGDVRRLDIVGINGLETTSGEFIGDGSLLIVSDPPDSCDDQEIPSTVTTHESSNRALYLYANIVSDDASFPSSPGSASGGAVAIVALTVAIVIAATLTVLIAVWIKNKRQVSVPSSSKEAHGTQNVVATDETLSHSYEFDNNYQYIQHYSEAGPVVERSAAESANTQPQSSGSAKACNTSALDDPSISFAKLLVQAENPFVEENLYELPADREDEIYVQLKTWGVKQIYAGDIKITGHLGSGQFGSVEQGVWKRQGTKPVDVALKSLTKTSEEDKVKFLQEAAIMTQFQHPNVISLHGIMRNDPVADFGLSRDLADEDYYVSHGKDKIPIKWTAPEAINYKKYSTASDVWSYGCLLYEIWSLGHKPFEGISNLEALRIIESGKRLALPPGCPKMICQVMILCWHPQSSGRPSFRDIVLTLVGSEEMVLNIPKEDSSTNPLAGVLGGPLEAGENMYSELQRRYLD